MADSVMDRSVSSGTGGGLVLRHITARSAKTRRLLIVNQESHVSSQRHRQSIYGRDINDSGQQFTAGVN